MAEGDQIKVALVGAGREGLETLSILKRERSVSLVTLLDPDKDALGFRLEEYGYAYADDLNLRLSHRMRELTLLRDLDLVVDTMPERYHRELYGLGLHHTEIVNGNSARFIWELKCLEDTGKRRSFITERISGVIEAIDLGLQSAPQAPPLDEHSALLLRTSLLGTHATAAQLTVLGKDGHWKIIKDINIDPVLLIRKGSSRPYIKERDEADRIIRAVLALSEAKNVVENKRAWDGGEGKVKGWDALTAIPVIEGPDVIGILWSFYTSSNAHFIKDDATFISSLVPAFGGTIKNAIEKERSRLASIEAALTAEPVEIIRSERSIEAKLKDVNHALYRLLRAEDSHLYIKDPATGDLVLQATTYSFPSLSGRMRIKKGQGILGEVFERNSPLILMETPMGDNSSAQRFTESEDTIAILYLPLIVKDKGVGIMSMEFTNIHHLTPNIYKSLKDIGHHLANSISGDVERYHMSQKIIKLSSMNEEGIEILSTADLQKVLALSTASSAMLFDSEVSILRLFEKGELAVKSTYGVQEGRIDQTLIALDHDIATMVSQTKIPAIVHDLLEYAEEPPAHDFPYKTAMVVPILFNKELFGTLSLYNKRVSEVFSSIFFTEDDREIIEYFIQYVARGVVNARRYSERQLLITIDDVTGLRNERYLQMRFPEEIKRAKRYGRCVSLIFFEVKPLDDTAIGDVARIVKETFRYIDVLVRLKEAKFAALLPDTGEGVKDAVKRLTNAFTGLKEKRPELTLYAGYSTYPHDNEDMHELIKKASRLIQY